MDLLRFDHDIMPVIIIDTQPLFLYAPSHKKGVLIKHKMIIESRVIVQNREESREGLSLEEAKERLAAISLEVRALYKAKEVNHGRHEVV